MTETLGRRVVLVGPPGAGKTSVGRVLAERWGTTLHDTDEDVERSTRRSIADLFVDEGEAVFRALEVAAVAAALDARWPVIALGGGAVLADATRTRLVGEPVVFLDVGLTGAAERVGLGVTRPLLLGNVRAQLKSMLDQRRPVYVEVSRVVVQTDDLTVEQVADAVEQAL